MEIVSKLNANCWAHIDDDSRCLASTEPVEFPIAAPLILNIAKRKGIDEPSDSQWTKEHHNKNTSCYLKHRHNKGTERKTRN